ncbi:hypothetical protein MJO29_007309 [Puccinia striiformis f. sp. tritici]|nr:hypothetical protein MJO29_007309 [Puccinia striiformis f. sp. tritici]
MDDLRSYHKYVAKGTAEMFIGNHIPSTSLSRLGILTLISPHIDFSSPPPATVGAQNNHNHNLENDQNLQNGVVTYHQIAHDLGNQNQNANIPPARPVHVAEAKAELREEIQSIFELNDQRHRNDITAIVERHEKCDLARRNRSDSLSEQRHRDCMAALSLAERVAKTRHGELHANLSVQDRKIDKLTKDLTTLVTTTNEIRTAIDGIHGATRPSGSRHQ